MSVPKLLFKEFDGDWANLKYKDVLNIKYGKDHKSLTEGKIPVYGTGGVMRYVDKYLYDGESILIGRKGTIDQPKYVNEKFWTVDTLFYTEVKDKFSPKFLYQHALQVNWLQLNEATGVPSLNTTSINNVDIGVPDLEEQTKIANFLSSVDEKISQLTQKHALLSQYKQGMMQKLFSQQLRFKADDGGEFGDWNYYDLGDVLDYEQPTKYIVSSTEYDNFFSTPVLTAGKTFILGYTSEVTGIFDATKNNVIIFDDFTTAYKFVNFKFKVKSSAMKILSTDSRKFNIYYIYSILSTIKYPMGDEHKRRWISEYSKQEVAMPCLEEQNKIANFLSAIDQKIAVVAQQIEQAKTWKKGLLQQMFV